MNEPIRYPTLPRPAVEARLLRLRELEHKTGIKHTLIYSLMKQGLFPKSLRIGRRAVKWHSLEIERWIDARIAERDAREAEKRTPP